MSETHLFVGCCGWTAAQALYLAEFPTIELQTTFYQLPTTAVAKRWKMQAPPTFRFCMKAWQLITHTPASPTYRRLKSTISREERDLYGSFRPTDQVRLAWERTRDVARILDAQVIVFQCPRSFLPTRENICNLSMFFRQIDRDDHTLAWEPRGDDWNKDLIQEVCAEHNLVHCVDPFECDPVYGDATYWRLHGRSGYRYQYSNEDLGELEAKLRARSHLLGSTYVMFNNIYSKQDARRLVERSGRLVL